MSAVRHSTAHLSAPATNNSRLNAIPSPPWDRDSLIAFCQGINNQFGERGRRYLGLLSLIQEKINDNPSLETCLQIYPNLAVLSENIPLNITVRDEVLRRVYYIERNLADRIRTHMDQDPAVVSKLLYRKYLKEIRNDTQISYLPDRIADLERELDTIPRGLKTQFESTIQKCRLYCSRKLALLNFARSHGVDMNPHRIALPPLPQTIPSSQSTVSVDAESESRRRIYPILSIDGGGIRGIIPATMLKEIENITREPIAKLFKLIGGTSTGGILALGLTKPQDGSRNSQFTAQDLLNFYTQENQHIFRPNPQYRNRRARLNWQETAIDIINNPKYLATAPFFDRKLGNARLSSALTDVLIITNTLDEIVSKTCSVSLSFLSGAAAFVSGALGNRNSIWSHDSLPKTVHFFTKNGLESVSYKLGDIERGHNYTRFARSSNPALDDEFDISEQCPVVREYNHDFSTARVAEATSAAPTFFPPVRVNDKIIFDGGILQNNPAVPCILYSLNGGHRIQDLFMVSLGTGVVRRPSPTPNLGPSLVSMWFETTQPDMRTDFALLDMLGAGSYYRFQSYFDNEAPELDDCRPDSIAILEDTGRELVEENSELLRDICKILKPDSI